MSLINDALKRKRSSSRPAVEGNPMQPVENAPSSSRFVPMLLLVLGIGALAGAAMFWFRGKAPAENTRKEPLAHRSVPSVRSEIKSSPPSKLVEQAAVVQPPAAALEKTPNRAEEGRAVAETIGPPPSDRAPDRTEAAPGAEIPGTAPAPAAPVAGAPPAAAMDAPFPALRLQAIYFRISNPSAVINNRTLRAGQSIAGAKVLSIEKDYVQVEFNGRQATLKLK